MILVLPYYRLKMNHDGAISFLTTEITEGTGIEKWLLSNQSLKQ